MKISEYEKALLFLDVRSTKKRLVARVCAVASSLLEKLESPSARVTVMSALFLDPFRAISKAEGYQVTVELRSESPRDSLFEATRSLFEELRGEVDPKHCAAVVGRDYVFKSCPPQPVCFQYLMYRREDFTHEAYSKRYAEVHSVFGLKTRGNEGYVQFHADPEASREVAEPVGCGRWDFDSVAQLELKSMARFFALGPYNATLGGLEDEKQFIDRARSAMFVSKVVGRYSR